MNLQNRTFEELQPGDSADLRRLIVPDDRYVPAARAGIHNLMHLPGADGSGVGKADGIAPGLFLGALVSAVPSARVPVILNSRSDSRMSRRSGTGSCMAGRTSPPPP